MNAAHILQRGETMTVFVVRTLVLFALFVVAMPRALACDNRSLCNETSTFVAELADFRTSKDGNYRIITATLSFRNKSNAPLILGYVSDSAVAVDEQGNRYTARNSDVRGIGAIQRNTFDPKFTLQPGERSDARIELRWFSAGKIEGVRFDFDLSVREIDALAGNQYRLGREHSLRFAGLTNGVGGRTAAVPMAGAFGAAASPTAPVAAGDPCNGSPRCASNGPVMINVSSVTAASDGNYHNVRVTLNARNTSAGPVILAYRRDSGILLDNYNNRYTVRAADGVRGIGLISSQKADPQFALRPGEARSFTLEFYRFVVKTEIGTIYSPDFVLDQLEILPSQQIRTVRELNFNFGNLTAGNFGNETLDAVNNINEAAKQLSEGLRSIFKKKD